MKTAKTLIGVMVVGAALVVPFAHAQGPDDRAGLRGPGAFASQQAEPTHPDNRALRGVPVESTQPTAAVRPDDRNGARGAGALVTDVRSVGHPDDRAGARGQGAFTTVVVPSSPSSFDWGDALIGGLGGVGAAVLLAGGVFLLVGQRSKTRVA